MIRNIRLIFWGIIILSFHQTTAQNTLLKLKVSNIKEPNGKLVVALYDKKDNFLKKGYEFKKLIYNVDSEAMTFKIEGLPIRAYSIAIFHDKNADGDCNRNFLGVPIEGYGFSNNIKPIFSAPKFDQTKFELEYAKQLHIKLIH